MGGGQSTIQEVETIMEQYVSTRAELSASNTCNQDVSLDFEGADIKNCAVKVTNKCSAMASADMDTIAQALQEATLTSEQKQVVEGIATTVEVQDASQDSRTKLISHLRSTCKADAENTMNQNVPISFKGAKLDCTDDPSQGNIEVYQYGDATANCVIRQFIEMAQKHEVKNKQENEKEGLFSTGWLIAAGICLLLVIVIYFLVKKAMAPPERQRRYEAAKGRYREARGDIGRRYESVMHAYQQKGKERMAQAEKMADRQLERMGIKPRKKKRAPPKRILGPEIPVQEV